MAKEYAKQFYGSKEWKKCRESFIKERKRIDGGLCMECGEEPGFIVHHKKEITALNIDNPYVTLNHKNLKYVCKKCHEIQHGNIKKDIPGEINYIFDEDGNPVEAGRQRREKNIGR